LIVFPAVEIGDKISSEEHVKTLWIDPRDGREQSIGSFSNTGVRFFSTPDVWEDALQILEAPGSTGAQHGF